MTWYFEQYIRFPIYQHENHVRPASDSSPIVLLGRVVERRVGEKLLAGPTTGDFFFNALPTLADVSFFLNSTNSLTLLYGDWILYRWDFVNTYAEGGTQQQSVFELLLNKHEFNPVSDKRFHLAIDLPPQFYLHTISRPHFMNDSTISFNYVHSHAAMRQVAWTSVY